MSPEQRLDEQADKLGSYHLAEMASDDIKAPDGVGHRSIGLAAIDLVSLTNDQKEALRSAGVYDSVQQEMHELFAGAERYRARGMSKRADDLVRRARNRPYIALARLAARGVKISDS